MGRVYGCERDTCRVPARGSLGKRRGTRACVSSLVWPLALRCPRSCDSHLSLRTALCSHDKSLLEVQPQASRHVDRIQSGDPGPSLAKCAFSRGFFPNKNETLAVRASDERDSRDFMSGRKPSATYPLLSGSPHAADERGRWLRF
jgi:hypothetical protein